MPFRRDITNEQIKSLYFDQGLNLRQVAKELKCSLDLINYRFKQIGLEKKSMSECVIAGKKNSVPLSREFLDILDGEMLGDGYIHRYKIQGAFGETFGFDKLEWAEYLKNLFIDNSMEIVGNKIHYRDPCGKSKNFTWSFGTRSTLELGEVHFRWYKGNTDFDSSKSRRFSNRKYIKTVPIDLKLTPKALLHWYIGDSSIYKGGGGCRFYTDGFSYEEVEFLRLRLKEDLGINSVNRFNKNIGLIRRERDKLLDIVGNCPVECYLYKWFMPETKNRKNRDVNDKIDMFAVERFVHKSSNLGV